MYSVTMDKFGGSMQAPRNKITVKNITKSIHLIDYIICYGFSNLFNERFLQAMFKIIIIRNKHPTSIFMHLTAIIPGAIYKINFNTKLKL
jgi:hypothetical protein